MGLHEEIVPFKNGEARKQGGEERKDEISTFPIHREDVVVGYALTSKKIKSFLQPKLEGLAR